jgi:DNA invertase Pin-like site-specific DNA recombinase
MQIGYARVSTGEQNLDLQTDALEEAGCERVYTDEVSGGEWQRPGLARAVDQLRDGDVLTVWRLDRLGRSMKDLIEQVERVEELGAEFRSLQEGIDTTTPGGRLTFHIFGALAEFERDMIRQRTMAGLRAAEERGRTGGRPRAIDEEDLPTIQKLMKDPEVPAERIAEMFDASTATLYRYVSPEGERRK